LAPGVNALKLFTFVIQEWVVLGRLFQHCLMFVGKSESLPKCGNFRFLPSWERSCPYLQT